MNIFITHGNRLIDFANPQNSDIHIDDIIHHLSMIPRFGGKLDVHYSVLDHSVFAATIAKTFMKMEDEAVFAVLMHDAQEAYLGDVTTPLKSLLPDYKAIEHAFEVVIRTKFKINISPEAETAVKTADLLALKAEKQVFFDTLPTHEEYWKFLNKLPLLPISARDYINSKEKFREAFNYYSKVLNL
ncbi:hypothetical protein [Actinobacillus capsulatus]|uniref:hypothetical protein n=1 Tax=Actinobacillus capsulatus TaxID=717 RepID=UPI00036C229F|nr:hypothetical protein [Actinobacillus capsulatus]